MQSNVTSMGLREWTMLIILSILWGGSFFLVAVSLEELPPLTLVALRSTVAAIVLIGIIVVSRRKMPTTASLWIAFLVMSIFNNVVPFSLIVWGQTQIASGLAAILNSTAPLFSLVIAHFVTHDEKMTLNKIIGLLIGFAGVSAIVGVDFLVMTEEGIWGQVAVIMASVSYAIAGVYGRRFGRLGVRPMVLATGQVSFSSLIMIPLALTFENPLSLAIPSMQVMLSILVLGVLSTVVAYILYFKILESAGATNALLVTLLIPISAIAFGAMFLGELLSTNHFVGMGLIGLGLLLIDGRLFRRPSNA